jgi:hypothetical protein
MVDGPGSSGAGATGDGRARLGRIVYTRAGMYRWKPKTDALVREFAKQDSLAGKRLVLEQRQTAAKRVIKSGGK